ncbi:helix-turn-helix transcriptional regulator [Actinomadura graeca]|uniref:Helix-turn-helix transcriptional regulator n=1 Tax=Actinomadura graeca TaxID=2750812 RepID=A0ABX8QQ22_9ACTN|nr:helix-turn-helix transcriptional regulator [Actinomadura graeca]QXJ20885.1 helix-turn-helix transcriptional regulator [Actinomadura graeca]
MSDASEIGRNLRRLRGDRGLSQERLAEAADVSVDLIGKLEQGRRQTARITTLSKLANALDVEISELIDRRERLGTDRDGGSLLALRDVLHSPRELPGFDLADDLGEPTSLDALERAAAQAGDLYHAGDFGPALACLPGLISEARVTHSALGARAVPVLTSLYELAANLTTQIGRTDLGIVAAERAITTAYGGDDPLLWACVHWSYAWVLLHQARFREAEDVSAALAAKIESGFRGEQLEIAVWCKLLVGAVAPTVAQGRDPGEYLSLARAGAERLGRRVPVYGTFFGPATVAMQETYGYSALRRPGPALEAAKRIRPPSAHEPGDLKGISWGAHLMDVAQAHLDAGRRRTAARKLLEARQVSPVWFRHQRIARDVTTEIREQERRPSAETRTLVKALSISG